MIKTSEQIREEAISQYKEIYIVYTQKQKQIRTEVKLTETVKGLKKK